jgi:hypothetical protein
MCNIKSLCRFSWFLGGFEERKQSQSLTFGRKYNNYGYVEGHLLPCVIRVKQLADVGIPI